MTNLKLITAPSSEPVDLATLKLHLRLDDGLTADDSYITALGMAGREYAENYTQRQLMTSTWEVALNAWPTPSPWTYSVYYPWNYLPYGWQQDFPRDFSFVRLPKAPTQSITSVQYYDANGNNQTLSTSLYRLLASTESYSYLVFDPSANLPTVQTGREDAIRVRFVAGYTAVPESIKTAIRIYVGEAYNRREETVMGTVMQSLLGINRILDQYRIMGF